MRVDLRVCVADYCPSDYLRRSANSKWVTMLKIRRTQRKALDEHQARYFENRMVQHVQMFGTDDAIFADEIALRELIRRGIARARQYSITAERDVCLFIDLMLAFGASFDTDPQFPWAAAILNDPAQNHPSVKIDALYEEALKHLPDEGAKGR